jgi:proline iminopeptidase
MFASRLLFVSGALAALAARPALRNWGSDRDDRARVLPGDWTVPGERAVSTMAITIAAPPAAIWPWLAQMGTDRAGWYSWDRLDNGGHASARHLEERWTHVRAGDRLTTVPGRSWFDVAHVEPDRSLVLRATLDLRGRPFDPRAGRPDGFVDARWEFFLDPRAAGTTRVIVRSGSASGPRPWTDIIDWVFWHPAHVIMQIRQLRQLKLRAERHAPQSERGETAPRGPHRPASPTDPLSLGRSRSAVATTSMPARRRRP